MFKYEVRYDKYMYKKYLFKKNIFFIKDQYFFLNIYLYLVGYIIFFLWNFFLNFISDFNEFMMF